MITKQITQFFQYIDKTRPLLSMDYGEKKCGFAISDSRLSFGMPIGIRDGTNAFNNTKDLLEKYNASGLVLGLPISLEGNESITAVKVHLLAEELYNNLHIPILLWDERFTSRLADNMLKEIHIKRDLRNLLDDQIAALIILNEVLESYKNF